VVTSQSVGPAPQLGQTLFTLQTLPAGYWPAGQLVQAPSSSQPAHAAGGQLQDPSAWQTLPVAAEQAGHGRQPPAPSL
jgi:hypothetical protein